MSPRPFRPGIDTLFARHRRWIHGARIGIVTHPAAIDARGVSSTQRLADDGGCTLGVIFGPEHGFFGHALAGEHVTSCRHPYFRVPVYSLYGQQRHPHPAMLRKLDLLLFDLQNLAARPYTYVATLRAVMEAAAAAAMPLIVADRPVALPNITDGPSVDPPFHSFVADVALPMAYGMTPGETAGWLRTKLALDLDLKIARMQGYGREAGRQPDWPPWIPPSPQIRGWESAQCYLATIFAEALPALDNGRGTGLAFQVFGAPWMNVPAVLALLRRHKLTGVSFQPHLFVSAHGRYHGRLVRGLRLVVNQPDRFKPVAVGIHILHALQEIHGPSRIWRSRDARPAFFDKLYATAAVREALCAGSDAAKVIAAWQSGLAAFRAERCPALLYARRAGSA